MTDKHESQELVLTIKFASPESAAFSVETTAQLHPYQLLAIGGYFEFEGKYALNRNRMAQEAEWARQMNEQQKIAVAKPNILKPQ